MVPDDYTRAVIRRIFVYCLGNRLVITNAGRATAARRLFFGIPTRQLGTKLRDLVVLRAGSGN